MVSLQSLSKYTFITIGIIFIVLVTLGVLFGSFKLFIYIDDTYFPQIQGKCGGLGSWLGLFSGLIYMIFVFVIILGCFVLPCIRIKKKEEEEDIIYDSCEFPAFIVLTWQLIINPVFLFFSIIGSFIAYILIFTYNEDCLEKFMTQIIFSLKSTPVHGLLNHNLTKKYRV